MIGPVIACSGLTKKYGSTLALDNLSLEIGENKIIGLIGRNGAGKTTLLKTCAGFLRPTSGNVRLWGEPVWDNIRAISRLNFIDEEIQYDSALKLTDILFVCQNSYQNWDDAFAKRLVEFFGLNLKKKYKALSRGMKTQFNIVVALAARMPLTLFDEPTLGLDAAFRTEFYDILLKDYMKHPSTILISSHLLSEIEGMLEEIVLIDAGRLVLHESVDEVRSRGLLLNGSRAAIEPVVKDIRVFKRQELGNSLILSIENKLDPAQLAHLKDNHVDISSISAQDMCIYLTQGSKGGFDDYV